MSIEPVSIGLSGEPAAKHMSFHSANRAILSGFPRRDVAVPGMSGKGEMYSCGEAMWKEKWNRAFETRDREAVATVLPEILDTLEASTDPSEKASFLLAAATCHAILGNQESVRRCLDEARRLAPEDDTAFWMNAELQEALWHSNEGSNEQSLAILDLLLSDFADELKQPQFRYLYEKAQFARGLALADLERFRDARPVLEEAESFDLIEGDRGLLFFDLGACHLVSDEDASALHCFLEAKRIGLGPAWQATLHFYIGRAYYRLKDYSKAKLEFLECERCLKSGIPGPATSDLYKLLAYSCSGLGQNAEAEMYSRLAKPA